MSTIQHFHPKNVELCRMRIVKKPSERIFLGLSTRKGCPLKLEPSPNIFLVEGNFRLVEQDLGACAPILDKKLTFVFNNLARMWKSL